MVCLLLIACARLVWLLSYSKLIISLEIAQTSGLKYFTKMYLWFSEQIGHAVFEAFSPVALIFRSLCKYL